MAGIRLSRSSAESVETVDGWHSVLPGEVAVKAQAALDKARREHDETATIEAERAAIDERAQAEEALWEKQRPAIPQRCGAGKHHES
ncbi:hypothetical protein [Bradyrhizobium australiense]|uniref:Uncharacterized protein n=1 Tax=Bradyrhizobium australiense TaxID=2721161 RepID=A0A7Y4GX65_9BRAD|nr:hypothetical protein [Bradyrhizobium australiense]NOJ43312.1 hypothetical protein [Bradyrhizobium australiense]